MATGQMFVKWDETQIKEQKHLCHQTLQITVAATEVHHLGSPFKQELAVPLQRVQWSDNL